MNLIKRLTTSVTATLDSAVGQLENHDAIVEATIKQTRQAVAKTRARINTLRHQQSAYERQLTDANDQAQLWAERAKALAASDKDKALQCVARLNHCQSEAKRLTQSVEQQKNLIHDVTVNLEKLQTKLQEMTHKHNLMRSRQTVANVNRAVTNVDVDETLSDTFERWESIVLEHEFAVSDVCSADSLDHELSMQESDAALMAQLEQLTQADGQSNDDTQNKQPEKDHE